MAIKELEGRHATKRAKDCKVVSVSIKALVQKDGGGRCNCTGRARND